MGLDVEFDAIPADRTRVAGEEPAAASLPSTTTVGLAQTVGEYWRRRVEQHAGGASDAGDSYAGVRMTKLPEDLRVYEHLLWLMRPNVVIEIGAQFGGSALWFRDRLAALSRYTPIGTPHVISIDRRIDLASETVARADPGHERTITFLDGDVTDPDLPAVVEERLPRGARCFVIEDSAHVHETTSAALRGFARFVPPGGFFVVEDGSVDVEEMRVRPGWPRGVLPAIAEWLASEEAREFEVRLDLELYGLTAHPFGILQRRGADSGPSEPTSASSLPGEADEEQAIDDPERRAQMLAEQRDAARAEAAELRRKLARARKRRRRESKRRKRVERQLETRRGILARLRSKLGGRSRG